MKLLTIRNKRTKRTATVSDAEWQVMQDKKHDRLFDVVGESVSIEHVPMVKEKREIPAPPEVIRVNATKAAPLPEPVERKKKQGEATSPRKRKVASNG